VIERVFEGWGIVDGDPIVEALLALSGADFFLSVSTTRASTREVREWASKEAFCVGEGSEAGQATGCGSVVVVGVGR